MNTPSTNNKIIGAVVVVLAVIVWVALANRVPSTSVTAIGIDPFTASTSIPLAIATSSDLSAVASPDASAAASPTFSAAAPVMTRSPWSYSATAEKKSYGQDEQINVAMTITNMTDATTSLNFDNGCELSYTIGGFDFSKHAVCTPGQFSIVLAPHASRTGSITHYPSLYRIPVGSYTMSISVVGYSSVDLPITITP